MILCTCCGKKEPSNSKLKRHVNSKRHSRVVWITTIAGHNYTYDTINKKFCCLRCNVSYRHWKDFIRHKNTKQHNNNVM